LSLVHHRPDGLALAAGELAAARVEERESAAWTYSKPASLFYCGLNCCAGARANASMSCGREFKSRPSLIGGPFSGSRFVAAGGDGGIRTLDRAL
jgi:hypothetical protein